VKQSARITHLTAAIVFTGLALFSSYSMGGGGDTSNRWRLLNALSLIVAAIAWFLFLRATRRENDHRDQDNGDGQEAQPTFPEGQARLIDSGRLPNRYNPRIELKEYEVCHFTVPAQRMIFEPLPEGLSIDPSRLAVRFAGGNFYYIVRPQEILLPAPVDEQIVGELVITNQRVIFLAAVNGFEIPLQSLRHLDCSAHLVDFQVRERRYTLLTESAGYAEKVLQLLQRSAAL
jgi:hypothetical protein